MILADEGFAGRDFARFITEDLGAHLMRPDRKDEKPRLRRFGDIRQWIQSVIDTPNSQLGFEHHGARTLESFYPRVASKLLALEAGVCRKRITNEPRERSLTAYATEPNRT
ncbi:hypothetical protein [Arthrobacter alpinus]|uniref:hypothetical protein n=1 Tax=Arthrobacter alpinus TaxID=656366 RepID=UPI00164927E3|nr:hypothetical protein [Arthrobacter alpinus]